jgi:hypothetical protein
MMPAAPRGPPGTSCVTARCRQPGKGPAGVIPVLRHAMRPGVTRGAVSGRSREGSIGGASETAVEGLSIIGQACQGTSGAHQRETGQKTLRTAETSTAGQTVCMMFCRGQEHADTRPSLQVGSPLPPFYRVLNCDAARMQRGGAHWGHMRVSPGFVERVASTAAGLRDQVLIKIHGRRDRPVA